MSREKEIQLGNCPACPTGTLRDQLAETFQKRQGRWVLLRNVPAQVCDTCGETVFSQQSAERIAQLVAPENQELPTTNVFVEIFDLAVMRGEAYRGLRPIGNDIAQGTTGVDIERIDPPQLVLIHAP